MITRGRSVCINKQEVEDENGATTRMATRWWWCVCVCVCACVCVCVCVCVSVCACISHWCYSAACFVTCQHINGNMCVVVSTTAISTCSLYGPGQPYGCVMYLLAHTHTHTYTRMHARTHTHIHTHTYTCTHARKHTRTHTHTHTQHTHTHITHTHAHTRTHTHTRRLQTQIDVRYCDGTSSLLKTLYVLL